MRLGEKQREHPHYLKSSIFCGQLRQPADRHHVQEPPRHGIPVLGICLGRHQKTTNCSQRAMLISLVEERIEELYQGQQLDPELRDPIEDMLSEELSSSRRSAETENRRLRTKEGTAYYGTGSSPPSTLRRRHTGRPAKDGTKPHKSAASRY